MIDVLNQFAVTCTSSSGFFDFPRWYDSLCQKNKVAEIRGLSDIWLVANDLIGMLAHISLLAAVAFLITGAIMMITSQGVPENVKKAQSTMITAGIGFVIAMVARSAVKFVGDKFAGGSAGSGVNIPDVTANDSVLVTIINTVSQIAASIAFIMLLIGGFHFVTSGGDSNRVAQARNTILYAVIGLVVSLLALGIINFIGGEL